jgi:hypothetical protein
MRKTLGLLLVITFLAPLQTIAATNPVAGKSCLRVGIIQSYNVYIFTCVKSGKKTVWNAGVKVSSNSPGGNTVLSINSFESVPTDNIVVKRINERIQGLRKPTSDSTNSISILTEKTVPSDALDSIKLQHQYMMQAFPEAFKWGVNEFVIFETVSWAKDKAITSDCYLPSQLLRPEEIPPTMWSITTQCFRATGGNKTISFLNWPSFQKYDSTGKRSVNGVDMWAYQAAQEGDGSLIQSYFYAGKDKYGTGNPLPAWYEQGGQFALSSVALAIQERKWRQSSLMQGRVYTCEGRKVEDSVFYNANPNLGGCHYALGAIATELLIGLYGFDAPISWLQNIEISMQSSQSEFLATWDSTFKKTYGITLDQFYKWANSYAAYLESRGSKKLPSDLLTALKK